MPSEKPWFFIFGRQGTSSLAAQYALEHQLTHLTHPTAQQLQPLSQEILVIEGSPELFREIEATKIELTPVFLPAELTPEEESIRSDYKAVGRAREIPEYAYPIFKKQLYPILVVLYGPDLKQNQDIARNYFGFSGLKPVLEPITINDVVSKLPKTNNYLLMTLPPTPDNLAVL